MKNVSSMHDSSSSHSRNSSNYTHNKLSKPKSKTNRKNTIKSVHQNMKVEFSGKQIKSLKKRKDQTLTNLVQTESKIKKSEDHFDEINKKLEKNNNPDSKSYKKLQARRNRIMAQNEKLVRKKGDLDDKFVKLHKKYYSALSSNYNTKAKLLSRKLQTTISEKNTFENTHRPAEGQQLNREQKIYIHRQMKDFNNKIKRMKKSLFSLKDNAHIFESSITIYDRK